LWHDGGRLLRDGHVGHHTLHYTAHTDRERAGGTRGEGEGRSGGRTQTGRFVVSEWAGDKGVEGVEWLPAFIAMDTSACVLHRHNTTQSQDSGQDTRPPTAHTSDCPQGETPIREESGVRWSMA
jgi:hypothetical protein